MDRRDFIKKGSIGFAVFSLAPSALLSNPTKISFAIKSGKEIIPHIRHGLLNLNLQAENFNLGPSWLKNVEVNDFYKTGFETKDKSDLIRNFSYLIREEGLVESIQIKSEFNQLSMLNQGGMKSIAPSNKATVLFNSEKGSVKLFYVNEELHYSLLGHEEKTHITLLKGTAIIEGRPIKSGDQVIIEQGQLVDLVITKGGAFTVASCNSQFELKASSSDY